MWDSIFLLVDFTEMPMWETGGINMAEGMPTLREENNVGEADGKGALMLCGDVSSGTAPFLHATGLGTDAMPRAS